MGAKFTANSILADPERANRVIGAAIRQGFGQLGAVNNPRYIQIGLKIFF